MLKDLKSIFSIFDRALLKLGRGFGAIGITDEVGEQVMFTAQWLLTSFCQNIE
jgi:hypothetical protein